MPHHLSPVALTTATLLLASATGLPAAGIQLRFIGSYTLPPHTLYQGLPFGGISGLQRNADGSYTALSDDRGDNGASPRFYTLDLDYDLTGFNGVSINAMTMLKDETGAVFPDDRPGIDPEAIRTAPNGGYYIASEGVFSTDPNALKQPFVAEFTANGQLIRTFDIPAIYAYADNATAGGRSNQIFEALAVAADGSVWVGNEDPLIEDGSHPSRTEGVPLRMTALDPSSNQTIAQYAYMLPKIQRNGTAGWSGLVEMLALEEGGFLTLERSANQAGQYFISVTHSSPEGATNILSLPSLKGATYKPMRRKVLIDMDDSFMGVELDNMEAMSFGKILPNGNRSLVIVSDDNFNPPDQTTLFMAFEIAPAPTLRPSGTFLMLAGVILAGLAGFGMLHRRKG